MEYGSLENRLGAAFVDLVILLVPYLVLKYFIDRASYSYAILLYPLLYLVPCSYRIVYHGVCGQTPGKTFFRLQVMRLEGSKIGFREAVSRSAPELVSALLLIYSHTMALQSIPKIDYELLNVKTRSFLMLRLAPDWYFYTSHLGRFWFFCDAIFILFSEQRRALHDRIAGTVVKRIPIAQPAETSQILI